MRSSTLAGATALGTRLAYDPQNDFAPIGFAVNVAYMLTLHASIPALTDLLSGQTELVQRMLPQGVEATGSTPEALGEMVRAETERWRKVIKSAGIAVEAIR